MIHILAGQTFIMFLMVLVGYVIYRTHLSDHEGNRSISNVLLMVVTPAMLMNAMFSIEYRASVVHGFLIAIVLGFLAHAAVIAVTLVLLRRKDSRTQIGMERYLAVYSNCGFMAIPLVSAVLGAEAVLYLSGYMIAFNILNWTHGLVEITGRTSARQIVRGLMTPTVICTIIGILVFLLQIRIESHVRQAVSYIGSMNTPLGMIVAGTVLAETGLAGVLNKPRIILVMTVKLVLAPAVTFLLLMLLRLAIGIGDELFYAILIPAACPTATTGTMMALRYNQDYEYANQVVVASTLLSMVSIPLIVGAAQMITG